MAGIGKPQGTGREGGMMAMEVVHQGVAIPFRYCRSRRRSLGLTVRPDRSVWVRVPLRTPLDDIRAFVARKADWIGKVWQRLGSLPPRSGQDFREGAIIPYQGREYPLRVEQGGGEAVALRGGELVVRTSGGDDPDRLAGLIDAWYRGQAVELFSERLLVCHRRMVDEELPFPSLVIRGMKSRWGSYSRRTGRICLNLNLVKAPLPCLDYVIIHELCHMKEMNHGPRFWKLVSRYVPDHGELRRQLRCCGAL
jgi:predicted metal-dependent hydrolase